MCIFVVEVFLSRSMFGKNPDETRVVKVNADLLAFEPLPIYIGITKTFKLGLREEAGVWQKNARRVDSTSVPL
jgi:hypothetical protein